MDQGSNSVRSPRLAVFPLGYKALFKDTIWTKVISAGEAPACRAMHLKSFVIVLVLISATVAGFFWGGYETLLPVWFLAGLFCVSAVDLWASLGIRTRELLTLAATTLAIASADEYLHVSTGVYAYFDRGTPSPISVFGTSLLMIFILVIARRLSKFLLWKNKKGVLGALPALVCIILQPALAGTQGYLPILKWPMIFLYVAMGAASVFYAYRHPLGWTMSLMISGMVVGATMEFIGSLEGMWSFHFLQPLPLFMILTWALRTWMVHAFCLLLGVDFAQ